MFKSLFYTIKKGIFQSKLPYLKKNSFYLKPDTSPNFKTNIKEAILPSLIIREDLFFIYKGNSKIVHLHD